MDASWTLLAAAVLPLALAQAPDFHGGPEGSFGIKVEQGDAFAVIEPSAIIGTADNGVPGHTTYRLALRLTKDAANVYTIFGRRNEPMTFPAAYQVSKPFGSNIGGINPAFFSMGGLAKYSKFDSWLTVGMTEADAQGAVSVIGDDVDKWSAGSSLTTNDGAVFWMNPVEGPSPSDANGAQGKGQPNGDITIAQLTVKTGTSFEARVNCQGRTKTGSNWETIDLRFSVSPSTHSLVNEPCTSVQHASVHACVANCIKCERSLAVLQRIVMSKKNPHKSCELSSGELAIDVMNLAVCKCGGKKCDKQPTPPPPPPPSLSPPTHGNGPVCFTDVVADDPPNPGDKDCRRRECQGWRLSVSRSFSEYCGSSALQKPRSCFLQGDKNTQDCHNPACLRNPLASALCPNSSPPPPALPSPPPPSGQKIDPRQIQECKDAASAAMIACCAPKLTSASINPTVLLLTCKAVKDGGKENMCRRHGCLTTLTFADKACAGAENKGSAHSESSGKPSEAHQLYDGLRQYVQCNTKAETLKCTNFAGMNAYALAVNRECCTGPGESCRHGFPSKCDAGCAGVLEPMEQQCGQFLTDMAPTTLTRLQTAAKICPKPCDNYGKFNSALSGISHYCCGGPGEKCNSGVPTTCDADCAEVLPGFVDACGDFLSSPMNVGIKQAVDETLAKCKSPGSRFGPNGGGH